MATGAIGLGSTKPVRSKTEVNQVTCAFDIGASGAHTLKYGTGMSVARTAAGKYTVTFQEAGMILLDFYVNHWPAVDAQPLDCSARIGTFTAPTAAADATVKYEAWDNDTTAQTELASGDRVVITAVFLKSL